MSFISVIKAEFSSSLLQFSVSHDLQKSSYYADLLFKKRLLLLMLKTVVLLHIFVKTIIDLIFPDT